jgi:hypothetical protein
VCVFVKKIILCEFVDCSLVVDVCIKAERRVFLIRNFVDKFANAFDINIIKNKLQCNGM